MAFSSLDIALHLLVLMLATNQIVETYRHGAIFANLRAKVEVSRWAFVKELTGCAFCFSHWIAGLLVMWWVLSFLLISASGWQPLAVIIWRSPLYWLAVTRLSHLLNDLWYPFSRTPKPGDELQLPDVSLIDESVPSVVFPDQEEKT
jgi:hypothetical protein